ncbi:MAG: NAD(P)/FAD-dependent oxidoreductase [Chloroflexi bacterium]|nr:NAD(P)/FAD-dependent oxidoreductase [Chloroflexota bacterium]
MTDRRCDVAIIGGGLAGCSAAIYLARQGARVVLLEAKNYPHHKVCGEVLSPECGVLLDGLGLTEWLGQRQPAAIDTVEITSPSGAHWEARLPGTALGISRYALDHALAEQAACHGVDLQTETTVTGVQGTLEDSLRLTTRSPAGSSAITARVVIGAYGKHSRLDHTLNRAFTRQPQPFVGLKAHFDGPRLPCRIELHTFPGGYCGLSEIENGKINACLLVQNDVFRQAGSIPAFLAWMQQQNPRLAAWFASARLISDRWYSISQIPFVDKTVVDRDVLMTGDAAGLIAPLAGNGMAMALRGAHLAAEHAISFLRHERTAADLRRQYAADWQREFRLRLRLGRLLQAFLLRPQPLALGLHLVKAMPPLGHFFIHNTRDTHLR